MIGACQHCGGQLAVGAVACFRCGRMVARPEEGGTGASVVVGPTQMGTAAKAELLEGQWRLVKLLGQGLVGQVWQGLDVTLDRAVAVKLMHEELASDPAQVARFEREARVLAGLEHSNLLPVLGIGRLGTRPFLVTRLLEGRTLAELMHQRGGKLPPSEAARVMIPICDALACLHEANVVHRDLKPSNVFVGDDMRVTLMDLGSAHEVGSELTQLGEVLGTKGYLSPEQQLGARGLDGKSDIYALGCLLLEVLTGKGGSNVPVALLELAASAMARAPAGRPTALEVKAKLAPFLVVEERTSPMVRVFEAPTPSEGAPAFEPPTKQAPVHEEHVTARSIPIFEPSTLPAPAHAPAVSQVPRRSSRRTAAAPNRRTVVLLGGVGALLLGAIGFGFAQPPARVPPPVRVDRPSVPAPIQKEELQLHGVVEQPKVAAVYVPNFEQRKTQANTSHGYEQHVIAKPRFEGGPGRLRLTTTVNGKIFICTMWIKRTPFQREFELLGRTPVEMVLKPGDVEIRLQHNEDPFILIPYRVPSKNGWFKLIGKMRVEIARPPVEAQPKPLDPEEAQEHQEAPEAELAR